MATSLTLHATLSIFIGANLIVSIKTDANLANSNSIKIYTHVEPLPVDIFSAGLRELLSPDMFTQSDPVHYLRQKAMQLPHRNMEVMREQLFRGLTTNNNGRIPPIYYPYAKLLWSVMSCIIGLDGVSVTINTIKQLKGYNPYSLPPPDISKLDDELSPLFSSDIFSDPNPPSVLIDKLLNIPEKNFSSITKKLNFPRDEMTLQFYQYYPTYSRNVCRFLEKHGTHLRNLQRYVAEIRQLRLPIPAITQIGQK